MKLARSTFAGMLTGTALCVLAGTTVAMAQSAQAIQSSPAIGALSATSSEVSTRFAPRPSKATRIDYEIWDVALKEIVLYGGPSLRRRAERPGPVTGSRFVLGHTSPFRLEGNKVAFEGIKGDFEDSLFAYVDDLIDVGNRVDIPALSKNEQLAYWMNLHNALIVRRIAQRYPIEVPSRIRGKDGLNLQDTKLATIDGVDLSLRDIREKIVYEHWDDPRVIYGFFLGELGGPSLQRTAFTGSNVWSTLNTSAREFAGSLRGVEKTRNALRVSKIYEDTAPFFFPDFENDVRSHLIEFGSEASKADVQSAAVPMTIARYEDVIADMTGGDGNRRPISRVVSENRNGGRIDNSALGRAIREQNEKFERIRERGLNAIVIIEDIETDPNASEADGDFIDPNAE